MRALLLWDVVGDDPAAIGSGLAAPDPTTYGHALGILRRYGLMGAVTPAVRSHLELGECGAYPDTPSGNDPRLTNLRVTVIATIRTSGIGLRLGIRSALRLAAAAAAAAGFCLAGFVGFAGFAVSADFKTISVWLGTSAETASGSS